MGSEGAGLGEGTGSFVLGVSHVKMSNSYRDSGADESMASHKVIIYSIALQRVTFCANIIIFYFKIECSKIRY